VNRNPGEPSNGFASLAKWNRGRAAITVAAAAGTLATVALLGDTARLGSVTAELAHAPLLAIFLLAAYAGAFLLRAIAWTVLLPTLGLRHALAILHAALFANHVAPIKVGEVLRPYLASRHGVDRMDAVATTVVARLLDLISLALLATLLMPSGSLVAARPAVVAVLGPAVLVGAVATLAWLRMGWSVPLLPTRLARVANELGGALRRVSPRRTFLAAVFTLPSWVLEGAVVLMAARAMGLELTMETAIAATAVTIVFQTVHMTPGGIGVYEASMSTSLMLLGVAPDEAFAVAVLAHGLKFAYSFTVGLGLTLIETKDAYEGLVPMSGRRSLLLGALASQIAVVAAFFALRLPVTSVIVAESLLLAAVVLAVLARQWAGAWSPLPPNTPASDDDRPVVLVIPAYNEADALPVTLDRVPHAGPVTRIIVVDDGSTDGTADVARRHGADVVITHERNRGLGAALRTGLKAARALDPKAVVYVDADGEYDPAEIAGMLTPVLSGDADYVLGSRYMAPLHGQRIARRMGNALFTGLLSFASGRQISDGQTGFRAFSPRALEAAAIVHDYNYAQVLTLDLLRKRMRLREVPVSWRPRCTGTSFVKPDYLWRVPLGMIRELLSP
jgi:uncharacterized protein (TIRG00374 family)